MQTAPTLLDTIDTMSWDELGTVLQKAAVRVNAHRLENAGMTPRAVFVPCLELGMTYACLEMLTWVFDDTSFEILGVLLMKRAASDQGWENSYHIPGVAIRPHDTLESAKTRLIAEMTLAMSSPRASNPAVEKMLRGGLKSSAFIEVHREDPDRHTNCMTAVYEVEISQSSLGTFLTSGSFKYFPREMLGDPVIVDHHRDTIRKMFPVQATPREVS